MQIRTSFVAMGQSTVDIDNVVAKSFDPKAYEEIEKHVVKAEMICQIMVDVKDWHINIEALTKAFARAITGKAYSSSALDDIFGMWGELKSMRAQMVESKINTSHIDNRIARIFKVRNLTSTLPKHFAYLEQLKSKSQNPSVSVATPAIATAIDPPRQGLAQSLKNDLKRKSSDQHAPLSELDTTKAKKPRPEFWPSSDRWLIPFYSIRTGQQYREVTCKYDGFWFGPNFTDQVIAIYCDFNPLTRVHPPLRFNPKTVTKLLRVPSDWRVRLMLCSEFDTIDIEFYFVSHIQSFLAKLRQLKYIETKWIET